MEKIKDVLMRYGFVAATLCLVVIYLLYQKRGRDISQLKADAEKMLLAIKLRDVREQSRKSEEDYEKSKESYAALKRRYGDVLAKHGLFTGAEPKDPKSN